MSVGLVRLYFEHPIKQLFFLHVHVTISYCCLHVHVSNNVNIMSDPSTFFNFFFNIVIDDSKHGVYE